jgi:hypothetical protein
MRKCGSCGKSIESMGSRARYCSATCRVRAHKGKVAELPRPASLGDVQQRSSGLAAAVERELSAAGRLETVLGQQALLLAQRIGAPMDTGSSVASLSRELREVMAKALESAARVADPMDELRALRERRNAG